MILEPEPAARETLVERLQQHRTTILIAVGCVIGTGLLVKACATPPAASSSNVPQVLSGPTTTTTEPPPPIDPLINLGQLSPTAAALVGPDFDARRERWPGVLEGWVIQHETPPADLDPLEQWAGRADHETRTLWADRSGVWTAVHEAAHVVAEALWPSRPVGHRPLFGERHRR